MSDKLEKLSLIELQGKKNSLVLMQMGLATIGTVTGWVYTAKTGGGFWRYVGYGLLGGTTASAVGYLTTMQRINTINTVMAKKVKAGETFGTTTTEVIKSTSTSKPKVLTNEQIDELINK